MGALPAQASCLGLVRWHALRCVITPVAMQTAASIALECGGKALVCGTRTRKDRYRFFPAEPFYRPGAEDRRPRPAAASRHEAHLVCHF